HSYHRGMLDDRAGRRAWRTCGLDREFSRVAKTRDDPRRPGPCAPGPPGPPPSRGSAGTPVAMSRLRGAAMFRMDRAEDREAVVFRISGRIRVDDIAEMEKAFRAERDAIILDLRDVALVDRDVVTTLARWELRGIRFDHCPRYIREWI